MISPSNAGGKAAWASGQAGPSWTGCTSTLNFSSGGAGVTWGANYSQIYDDGDIKIKTDDNLRVFTAGSQRIQINASGNVGINNNSPGAYSLDVGGDMHSTGWLRTLGNAGWYSQTYGGGWYMTDATYMRCLGDKTIYSGGGMLTNYFHSSGDANSDGVLYCNGNTAYAFYANLGSLKTTGNWLETGNFWVGCSMKCAYRFWAEAFSAVSDERCKTDVAPFPDDACMDVVDRIQQKHFRLKSDDSVHIGWIAQECEPVVPCAVMTTAKDDLEDFRVLDKAQMAVLNWGATRGLAARVEALAARLGALRERCAARKLISAY
jgi:hypothetical protein